MFFKPKDQLMGDTWQYSDGNTVHTFFLQWRELDDMNDAESGSVGHIVSDDMINWRQLPHALVKGEEGSYDDIDLWTGSCIEKDGKAYLFYTSRTHTDQSANYISLAISEDKVNFTKYEGNPIITPDGKYYCSLEKRTPLAVHGSTDFDILDCRDLQVIYVPEEETYYGYIAMRRHSDECSDTSVIALLKSRDLINWEQYPPCFTPDKYHCIETPDVFKMGDKWYMLCLTGNHYGQRNPTGDPNMTGCLTIYAVADSPAGPFREPENNVLLGSSQLSGICAKTVLHKGKRYLFYTQSNTDGQSDERTLAYPKEVVSDENGRLKLLWYDGIDKLFSAPEGVFTRENAIINTGKWGSIAPVTFDGGAITISPRNDWAILPFNVTADEFILDADIYTDGCRGAGIAYGIDGDNAFSSNRFVLLDYEGNEVWFTKLRNFAKFNGRRVPLNGRHKLRLLIVGSAVEVYLDGVLVLHHQENRKMGKLALFAERGSVTFDAVSLRTKEK